MKSGDRVRAGAFKLEFMRVNHSIPDAIGMAIHTPVGLIVHTGDFKIDQTPVDGQVMELNRFAEYGDRGVLLMMADSTNAERPGYTQSEKFVGKPSTMSSAMRRTVLLSLRFHQTYTVSSKSVMRRSDTGVRWQLWDAAWSML